MAPLIHHLTLCVTDVDRSARWYQQLLGEATVVDREGPDFRRKRMNWPGGLVIGVTEFPHSPEVNRFTHLNAGLDHVGLACASHDEVHAWADKIDRLGFTRGPVEEAPYGLAVTARDPDNIPIEFFCSK